MPKILRNITTILMLCSSYILYGQEMLVGLSENPRAYSTETKTKGLDLSLELPFFDDFSTSGITVPARSLWAQGRSVFVNTTFAIKPPTIGVATFDPFDHQGRFYANAGPRVFPADTLTSRPINLNNAGDAVYLSFFYQAQGYGDMPEKDDLFTLEFYNPTNDSWELVWQASANEFESYIEESNFLTDQKVKREATELGSTFQQTSISINQANYLKDGFRFRFINYASINVNSNVPGRSTASDHWHLDYVYLDKNRSNNPNLPDIAIFEAQTSLGQRYTQVPASHFNSEAYYDFFQDPMSLSLTYTNLGWGTRSVRRFFSLRTLYGIGNTIALDGNSENINNGEIIRSEIITEAYNFQPDLDSGAFEIRNFLTTDNDPSPLRAAMRKNDTTSYIQWFRDCYAYDDGTAENGYGIFGEGTIGGKVAVRFSNYISDSLRGVYLYFNRALNNANAHPFRLAIWEDNGGEPGRLISMQEMVRPVFRDSLNKYVAYKFPRPIFIGRNRNYYLGWIQTTEDFMNIGFDRNTNSVAFTYFNLGQFWENTRFEGTLMIRPIYTRTGASFPPDYEPIDPPRIDQNNQQAINLYPNPVHSGLVFLTEKDRTPVQASKVEVFDHGGHLIKTIKEVDGTLDTQNLSPGLYLVRIWDQEKIREVKRLLVIE